jgi:hypothetical protein
MDEMDEMDEMDIRGYDYLLILNWWLLQWLKVKVDDEVLRKREGQKSKCQNVKISKGEKVKKSKENTQNIKNNVNTIVCKGYAVEKLNK